MRVDAGAAVVVRTGVGLTVVADFVATGLVVATGVVVVGGVVVGFAVVGFAVVGLADVVAVFPTTLVAFVAAVV